MPILEKALSRKHNQGSLLIGTLIVFLAACSTSPAEQRDRFIQAGDQAIASGKTSEAVLAYRNAVQADPLSGDAHLRLADALAKSGEARGALGEYVRAADLKPDDFDLQIKTGNLLFAIGRLDDAQKRAEAILDKNPSHVEAHILLGNALGGHQDLDKALAQMEEAINLDPTRAGSHMQLALVQQARGKTAEAEAALKKSIELAPNAPSGYLALGNFYLSSARLADASAAFDAALKLDGAHLGANRAKAVLAFMNGRPHDAEPYLKRMAETSTSPGQQMSLGDYYLAVGKVPEATAIYERLSKDSRNELSVMPRLVRAYASAGNAKGARELVARLLQQNPNNYPIRVLESQLLLDEGKRQEALTSAQLAVKGDPISPAAQFTLGRAYAALGDRPAAETAFSEVLKINPRATPAQVELALLRLGESGATESVRLAEEAAKGSPGNLPARLALVRSLIASGDLTRAERELNIVQLQRPTAAGYTQAGNLALARYEFAKAHAAFDKAIELSPDSVEAFAGHLSVDLKEGNVASARARLNARLASGKPSIDVMLVAARTYMSLNDFTQSEAVLRRVIEIEPASLAAYSMLGQTYLRLGRLDDARAEFDRLAARQARPVGALTAAGTILQAQGKVNEARERFERVVGLDPTAAVAANNLAWIYADSGQQINRAIELAQSALQRLPDVPDVLDTLGWAYYKSPTPAQAVRPLSRCIEVAPKNAVCHYHLGLVHAKLGDSAQAEQSLRTSIKLQANAPWAADAQRALATLPPAK